MPGGVLVCAVLLFVLFALLQIVHVVPLEDGVLLGVLSQWAKKLLELEH